MRLKCAAIVVEDADESGGLLFEADDSLDLHPRAHDVDGADLPTLRVLAGAGRGGDLVDPAVVERWRSTVPGLIRDDSVDDEHAALRAFAAEHRFTLEFISADEARAHDLDTGAYHEEVISDADTQFDDVETTLAHLFAYDAAALGGRRFGGAFCDAVVAAQTGKLTKNLDGVEGLRIVELGCGTGRFANDFLCRLRETRADLYQHVSYTLVDLSPALQASQRRRCADHGDRCRFVSGDLLAFAGGEFDVVVSNEVIADLAVDAVYRDRIAVDAGAGAAAVRRYGLDVSAAPHAFLVNTGAVALVERLGRLLAPHGLAIVTEYGSMTRAPIRVVLGGHVEHSIQFGHLEQVARQVGLVAETRRVVDLVGLDEAADVAVLEGLDVLRRAVGPLLGLPALPRMAFGRSDIAAWLGRDAERAHGLRFVPLGRHPMRADLFLAHVARRA